MSAKGGAFDEVEAALVRVWPEGAAWPPPGWLRELFRGAGAPMDVLAASARAEREDGAPWLIAIVQDDDLSQLDAVAEGEAPARAAHLLGELGWSEGIPALIEAFTRVEEEDDLYDVVLEALVELGPAILEPVLAARAAFPVGDSLWYRLALPLPSLPPDNRIREVILETLGVNAEQGAELAAVSQDAELVPALRARWEACVPDASSAGIASAYAGLALSRALRDMDAPWGEADSEKLANVMAILAREGAFDSDEEEVERQLMGEDLRLLLDDEARLKGPDGLPLTRRGEYGPYDAAAPLVRPDAPGRNEPCWCGSGKKYKKCHADADRA